jgi:SAM-dependent methyltransferase
MNKLSGETCQVCSGPGGHRLHVAREMMFGLGGSFRYRECHSCGCLQLLDVPEDMSRFYPDSYGAFITHAPWKTRILARRAAHAFGRRNVPGFLLSQIYGPYDAMAAVGRTGLSRDVRILDVGCGSGELIRDLRSLGYENVSGIDAFLPADLVHPNGVIVRRMHLTDVVGRYDVVMLHHSFEHMAEPRAALQRVSDLLEPGGVVILRIPVASSWAWRHYGVDWMHLDAPRHLFLHTVRSIEILSVACGLRIENIVGEGDESQFLGSEQYRRGIPLTDARSFASGRFPYLRGWARRRAFRGRAEELARTGQGDQACFSLRKPGAES